MSTEKRSKTMEDCYHSQYLDNLSKGVQGMWLKQRYTDVVIKVGEKTYSCHRALLGSLSNYFKELFMTEKGSVVDVSQCDSATFEAVLQYIYTGRNDLVKGNIQAVLKAAVCFQIPCLQQQCEDFLRDRLTPETCIGTWRLATALGCSSLVKQSWTYLLEVFPSVLKGKEFADIGIDDLIAIINDDDLNTPSEEAVCTAVVKWVEGDPANRKQNFERLFGYIRFPLISAKYMESLKENPLVAESNAAQNILNDVDAFLSAGSVNPRQFHHRQEEVICVIGTRSRQPNPEATEIKCFSFSRDAHHVLASLPEEPGACFAVCANNNDVYVSGGYMGQKTLMRFLSSKNRWQTCSHMLEGRWGHAMESSGGAVYILGGSKKVPETISSIEMYDPSTDSSSVVGNLAIPVFFAATAAIRDKIFIFGGKLESRTLCQKVQCFDTKTGECKVVGEMPLVSSATSRVAVLEDTAYIFYGQGEVLKFTEGGQPTIVAQIPQFDHFGVVTRGGQIIIDGSQNNQPFTFVFDPSSKEVSPYARAIKAALCNFYCMNVVMSRDIVRSENA